MGSEKGEYDVAEHPFHFFGCGCPNALAPCFYGPPVTARQGYLGEVVGEW